MNFTAGRVHNIAVIVSPSMYLDNTFLNNAAGVSTIGYRAAFAGYTVTIDPLAMQVRPLAYYEWRRSMARECATSVGLLSFSPLHVWCAGPGLADCDMDGVASSDQHRAYPASEHLTGKCRRQPSPLL